MLQSPPPGFNPSSINRQSPQLYQPPGQRGWQPQGYQGQPFHANVGTSGQVNPSAIAAPSSMPGNPAMPANHAIIRALQGGR